MADKAGFDEDVAAAISAVESARTEAGLVDQALDDPLRRGRIRDVLREVYAEQGLDLDDAVLDRAIDLSDRGRFRHVDGLRGPTRLVALAYVRRGRIAAGALALAAVAAGGVVLGDHREAAEAARAAAVRAELDRDVAGLRARIATTSADARSAGADPAAVDRLAASATSLVEARDVHGAGEAVAGIERLANSARARITVEGLRTAAADLERRAAATATAPDARAALAGPLDDLREALRRDPDAGSAAGAEDAMRRVRELVARIGTPLTIRIVDRGDQKSGVRRTNSADGSQVSYLIVEAIGPDGRAVPQEVVDFETGRRTVATTFGIQVPADVYRSVGDDKKADGVVDDRDAGTKPAGTLAIRWDMPTSGNIITQW